MDLIRPAIDENDEEALLKAQQDFLAKKESLSVRLDVSRKAEKRKCDTDNALELSGTDLSLAVEPSAISDSVETKKDVVKMEVDSPSGVAVKATLPKRSKFASARKEQKLHQDVKYPGLDEEMTKKHQQMFGTLRVIERDTHSVQIPLPQTSSQPFPVAERIDTSQFQELRPGRKGKSLFAQWCQRAKSETAGAPESAEVMKDDEMQAEEPADSQARVPGMPHLVTGLGLSASFGLKEARKIHTENASRLATMSEEEILAERQKLLQQLDPKLLDFLVHSGKGERAAAPQDSQPGEQGAKKSVRFSTKSPVSTRKQTQETEVPIEVKGEWLHMDEVESDKLAWMKDLPPPSANNQSGGQARFDFHGNLLPAGLDIAVNLGLHHHGQEPERAGYSLEELFSLARSANVQQRTLSLNTLARILAKAKEGDYTELVQTPVVPTVVNAGAVFLLRWALDDQVDSVQSAALAALHSLIGAAGDEAGLDHVFGWFHGHVAPAQRPATVKEEPEGEEEDAEKLSEIDADVAQRDVILALVTRMSLLRRLHYILEHRRPPAPTTVTCLSILTRVARHSPALAYEVVRSPGLLEFVFKTFLPVSWEPVDSTALLSSAHGLPLPAAMRLTTVLCQAGRNMAATLVNNYGLGDRILHYLSAEPSELRLASGEATLLHTESYRTWTVCLGYGLTAAIYSPLYGHLMERLRRLQQSQASQAPNDSLLACYVAMVSALDMALHVASAARLKASLHSGATAQQGDAVASPTLHWHQVEALLHPIQTLAMASLADLGQHHQHQKRDLQLLTAVLKFLGSFYSLVSSQADYDPVRALPQLETLFHGAISSCWRSLGFRSILQSLSLYSNYLSPPSAKNQELAASLGDLGCSVPGEDCLLPVLRHHSPFGLLSALLRLLLQLCHLHRGLVDAVQQLVLQDEDVLSYLRKVAQNQASHLHDNHFSQHENFLQYFILRLCALKPSSELPELPTLHTVSLLLLQRLPLGLVHLSHGLLSSLVFRLELLGEGGDVQPPSDSLAALRLVETKATLTTATPLDSQQLLQQALAGLPSIRTTYLAALAHLQPAVVKSRHQMEQCIDATDCLMLTGTSGAALPQDWIFLPILNLYSSSLSQSTNADSKPSIAMVTGVLQWVVLLEMRRSGIVSTLSPTLKLTRVLCTFLAGNDLFQEVRVQALLAGLLHLYSRPSVLDRLDLSESVPGMASFYDLYISLLEQYLALSYSDLVFSCYILLPLMRRQSVELKLAVWGEHAGVLRLLSIPLDKVLVPVSRFLTPDETDAELISQYCYHLVAGTVQPQWSPFFYLLAVHHLNRFLYFASDTANADTRSKLWTQLLQAPIQDMVHHVIYYKDADLSRQFGMELYSCLPAQRLEFLNSQRLRCQQSS